MKTIDKQALAGLSDAATKSLRLRTNLNLHTDLQDPVQRFLNAIEPGSYVRPHRHADRWELMALLSGAASLLTFADDGTVLQRVDLTPNDIELAELPANVPHSLVATAPGTVILEVKQGPYIAATNKDFSPWAPVEGSPEVSAFLTWLAQATPGQRP